LLFFYLNIICRFYKTEEEFAILNDRIRRGDIVGAKGQPSKYIFHMVFLSFL
jgi:hypothetical protein